jgi:hypothetical protein
VQGADLPAGTDRTFRPRTPDEWRQAGETAVGNGVLRRVQGLDLDPVIGAGGQQAFGRAVEVFGEYAAFAQDPGDELLPRRAVRLGELGGERQLVRLRRLIGHGHPRPSLGHTQ